MGGEVVSSVPLDAADIGRGRDRRAGLGEVAGAVASYLEGERSRWRSGFFLGEGNHIEVVEEDPEDFLGDVDYLAAPHAIWAQLMHLQKEVMRSVGFGLLWICEIAEDGPGTWLEIFLWCCREVGD